MNATPTGDDLCGRWNPHKRGRMAMRVLAAAALGVAALGFHGCAADYVTEDNSDVLMRIVQLNDGDPLQSDVLDESGETPTVFDDEVDVAVAVRFKNPNLPTPSVPNAVFLERYEIQYVRSDGRATPGVDVPFPLTGNVTGVIDVASSGSATIPIEIVRVQQKLEPPLLNLRGGGGGSLIITCFANVTLHGRTTSGKIVSATGSLQVDFANWGDN
jgi:hypothetical protein